MITVRTTLLTVVLLHLEVAASVAQWKQSGAPSVGVTTCFAQYDSLAYLGNANGGVFVSSDRGNTWTAANTVPGGLTLVGIAVLPDTTAAGQAAIFAGELGGGVFISTDGGRSWNNTGLPSAYVQCLISMGTELYAGTWSGGAFRSTDGGKSWKAINKGLPSYNGASSPTVTALAVGVSGIYAGTNSGVYLTKDSGATWDTAGSSLNDLYIMSLAAGGNVVAAGTFDGLFLSTNNGSTWATTGKSIQDSVVLSLAIYGTSIFAGANNGLYVSPDGGTNWSREFLGAFNPEILAIQASANGILAGTGGGGVFKSTDDGSDWLAVSYNLSTSDVQSFLLNGSSLYAGGTNGMFVSQDFGSTWKPISTGLSSASVSSIAQLGGSLLASTNNGVYRSSNDGLLWTPSDSGLNNFNVSALAVIANKLLAGTSAGIYASTDSGLIWTAADSGLGASTPVSDIWVSDSMLITFNGSDVFISGDSGVSWNTFKGSGATSFLTYGPRMVLGTSGGIYVSTDAGGHWNLADSGLYSNNVTSLLRYGNAVFAGTGDGILFVSTDSVKSWNELASGLPLVPVLSLAVAGGDLFAGVSTQGVWKITIPDTITSVHENRPPLPGTFVLKQNYPNPFNPSTRIDYYLSAPSIVMLEVFDVIGRKVTTAVDGRETSGYHSVIFDAGKLSSGIYFYRLSIDVPGNGHFSSIKKMVVLK